MFFGLGFLAQLIHSDLKLPTELTKLIAVYLLLSIGIHGGIELSHIHCCEAIPSILVAIFLGVSLPIIMLAMMESPAILVGLFLASMATRHYLSDDSSEPISVLQI